MKKKIFQKVVLVTGAIIISVVMVSVFVNIKYSKPAILQISVNVLHTFNTIVILKNVIL